jgi:hypothetical protein
VEAGSNQLDELSAARLAEGRGILGGLVARYDALRTAAMAERDGGLLAGAEAKAMKTLEARVNDDPLGELSIEQSRCLASPRAA